MVYSQVSIVHRNLLNLSLFPLAANVFRSSTYHLRHYSPDGPCPPWVTSPIALGICNLLRYRASSCTPLWPHRSILIWVYQNFFLLTHERICLHPYMHKHTLIYFLYDWSQLSSSIFNWTKVSRQYLSFENTTKQSVIGLSGCPSVIGRYQYWSHHVFIVSFWNS